MMKSRKLKVTFAAACLVVGGTVASCAVDVRDNLRHGVMDAIEAQSQNWVGSLLVDLNEIFEAMPDNAIDTP